MSTTSIPIDELEVEQPSRRVARMAAEDRERADRARPEKAESMAERTNKFYAWVLGINASLVILGVSVLGSVLWGMSRNLAVVETRSAALADRIGAMESTLAAAGQSRYTSGDAARDRQVLADQLTAQALRLSDVERTVRELAEFRAQVRERMKLEAKP